VGWVEDATFDEYAIQLEPGDRLFLYSDGVPEAMDANLEQLTDSRMLQELDSSRQGTVEEQIAHLKAVVDTWCQPKGPLDDVSMLMIEIQNQ
jgi:sigma-B regulation protein RsbU (phosphoserine phosphatase)